MAATSVVTDLLLAWRDGDSEALEQLIPLVEKDLRAAAHHYMRGERPGHSLQTSALVNETYLRLVQHDRVQWQDRAHFLAMAGRLMRQILIDHARRRRSEKRGGQAVHVSIAGLEPEGSATKLPLEQFVDLHMALEELASLDDRQADIAQLRYIAGMSVEQVAEALRISSTTVKREWNMAQAWLKRRLRGQPA